MNKTVIVVDDESIVRDLITNFLVKLGYNVLEASDGAEALTIFENQDEAPTVLVTDIVMPKLGGQELARLAREKYPDLAVLFVSSYPDKKLDDEALSNPLNGFLPKPFSLRNFATAISTLTKTV